MQGWGGPLEGGGAAAAGAFAVGDVVEANYGGEGHWYPGRIASFDSGVMRSRMTTGSPSRVSQRPTCAARRPMC